MQSLIKIQLVSILFLCFGAQETIGGRALFAISNGINNRWIAIGKHNTWFQHKSSEHNSLKGAIKRIKDQRDLESGRYMILDNSSTFVEEHDIEDVLVSFECTTVCADEVADLKDVRVIQDQQVDFGGNVDNIKDLEIGDDNRQLFEHRNLRRRRRRRRQQPPPPLSNVVGSWGLNRIDQTSLPLPLDSKSQFTSAYSGKGQKVYILDTGLNKKHKEWAGRGILGGDFSYENSKNSPNDLHGHGSHCAGSAVGTTVGVAREATVIGVKVLNKYGSGSTTSVIRGIDWALGQQNGKAAVLSLSLGSHKNAAMDEAVKGAANKGMIVVVAAGNQASDACHYSPAGAGGDGRNGGVITVGSTDKVDQRSGFSNFGSCVDIFAPGSAIRSAYKNGFDSYYVMSGTSMATPHVAGVAATLLQKHGGDKDSAISELFAISVTNKVKKAGLNSPNLFLQTTRYTGPPTMPTVLPTPPPSFEPIKFCVEGESCYQMAEADFARIPNNRIVQGEIVTVDNEYESCDLDIDPSDEFKGKIVMVKRGGCMFFTKAKFATMRGAIGVIIDKNTYGAPYSPEYYGNDELNPQIPTIMIGMTDARNIRKMIEEKETPVIGQLGSPSFIGKTMGPTLAPTTRRKRRKRRGLLV